MAAGRKTGGRQKGTPNKEGAMQLLNFIIQPEQQARFGNLNRSAPTNPRALSGIDPEIVKELASAPDKLSRMINLDELGSLAQYRHSLGLLEPPRGVAFHIGRTECDRSEDDWRRNRPGRSRIWCRSNRLHRVRPRGAAYRVRLRPNEFHR